MFSEKIGVPELMVLFVIFGIFGVYIVGWAKVFSKAGYSGAMCLLMLVPGVNLITFIWFAFSSWPVRNTAGGHIGTQLSS